MSSPVQKESFFSALIVGVIVAGVQILGTLHTVNKQEEMRADLTRRIAESSKIGEAVANKKTEFHNQAISLIGEIDEAFHEICYLIPLGDAEKRLADALAKYHDLLTPPLAGFESKAAKAEEIKKAMREYSKFVIAKWDLIKSKGNKVSDQQKEDYYMESQALMKLAINQAEMVMASGTA